MSEKSYTEIMALVTKLRSNNFIKHKKEVTADYVRTYPKKVGDTSDKGVALILDNCLSKRGYEVYVIRYNEWDVAVDIHYDSNTHPFYKELKKVL